MNLLYTITGYPPSIGGTQLYLHLLAQALKDRHQIQVISHWERYRTDWLLGTTLRAPEADYDYVIEDIPVHRMGISRREKTELLPFVPIYYLWMDLSLEKIARHLEAHLEPYAEKADLVHNVRQGREGLSYASHQAARQRDIPFVLTPAHHPRWVGWRYRPFIKLYQMADAVIALTQTEKQILAGLGVKEGRIFVTGMGPVLAPQAQPESFLLAHPMDGPMVLFLGSHFLYKGYRQVLQAARRVWEQVPNAQFVFIGSAVGRSEADFETYEDPRIHRLKNVDLQEKTNALAACTLLCVPSTQESFGAIYTEAWSFAKPVIGCPIPAVSEVIADGEDGFLVEQDPDSIAERIVYLLRHPAEAAVMGRAGQQKVETRYTWEKLAALTEAAYQAACSH